MSDRDARGRDIGNRAGKRVRDICIEYILNEDRAELVNKQVDVVIRVLVLRRHG